MAAAAAVSRRSTGGGAGVWRRYVAACDRHGGTPDLPVTPEKVMGFALGECLRGMSTRQLPDAVGSLLRHAEEEELAMGGWTAKSRRRVDGVVALLCEEFPAEVIRARPLTDEVLRQVRAYLAPFLDRGDRWALMWWALLTLSYAACLRSIEYLQGALTAAQISVVTLPCSGRQALCLDLPFSKGRRNVRDGERDRVAVPRRSDADQDIDAFPAVQAYMAAVGHRIGVSERALFEPRNRTTGDPKDPLFGVYKYSTAMRDLRWLLHAAGVADADAFSTHSMRRGGATLLLSIGTPWKSVKRIGRWASDDAMDNYDARVAAVAAEASSYLETVAQGHWAGRLAAR